MYRFKYYMVKNFVSAFFTLFAYFVQAQPVTKQREEVLKLIREEMSSEEVLANYDLLGLTDSTCLNDIPGISPLRPDESPYITSRYGRRLHPLDGVYKQHQGLDLACSRGFQFVYATANGQVVSSGYQKALGNFIVVGHPSGYETVYGHLSAIYTSKGDPVVVGEVIGVMGQSGHATGTHLHYSIRKNGQVVNPALYLELFKQYLKEKTPLGASFINYRKYVNHSSFWIDSLSSHLALDYAILCPAVYPGPYLSVPQSNTVCQSHTHFSPPPA